MGLLLAELRNRTSLLDEEVDPDIKAWKRLLLAAAENGSHHFHFSLNDKNGKLHKFEDWIKREELEIESKEFIKAQLAFEGGLPDGINSAHYRIVVCW